MGSKPFAAALLVLGVIVCVQLGAIPGSALTPAQHVTVGIVIIAAALWISEWVPLFVVSFLILALQIIWLFPLLQGPDATPTLDIFFAPFFSDIILLFLGGFVLSSLMQAYGLDLRFAHFMLRQTHGIPSLTLLGIILTCAFLSMWISNTATTAMMLAMVGPVLRGIAQHQPFRKALVLAIPFACNLGGIGTPIGTPPNIIALNYLNASGIAMTFGKWILLSAPFLIITLLILWQVLLRLFPPPTQRLNLPPRQAEHLSPKHWAALGIFISTALGWLFSGFLGLSTGSIALLPIIASFWWGLLNTKHFRNLPWDVIYMVAGGMALAVALRASSLDQVIIHAIPFGGSPQLCLVIICAVALLLSTVMSNTATAGLAIPLVINLPFADQHLLSLVVALALTCSMAMALPVSTPPNAIAFSAGTLRSRDMLYTGGLLSLIGFVLIAVFGSFYWALILA